MTKSETEEKTALREEYSTLKTTYKSALEIANELSTNLGSCSDDLEAIVEEFEANYIINEKPGDNGETEKLLEEIDEYKVDIDNKVIVEIENQINDLQTKIDEIDTQLSGLSEQ